MIKNKKIALGLRIAALLTATAGLLDLLGVFQGNLYTGVLYYYTAQSNIMAILFFIILTVKTAAGLRDDNKKNACYLPRFSMICTINVLLTFFVFWILLVPQLIGILPLWTFSNLAVHAITPLLCLADYIMFSEPRRLKYRDVYYVVIFPICYVIYSSVIGLSGYSYGTASDGAPVRFPYFFYDFDRIGMMSFVYIGCIVVFFLIISHIFYYIDAKVRK